MNETVTPTNRAQDEDAGPESAAASGTLGASGTAVVYLGFLYTGIVTTLLGPVLPALASHLRLDDGQSGYFFAVQFVASTLGVLTCSRFLAGRTYRTSLLAGLGLMSVGTASLSLGGFATALLAVFCYGFGQGIIIPTTNLLVADTAAPGRRGAALNLVNLAWGIGAVTGPGLVAALQHGNDVSTAVRVVGACGLGMAVLVVMAKLPDGTGRPVEGALGADHGTTADRAGAGNSNFGDRALRVRLLWFAAMMFFYVGCETSVGGWSATFAERIAVRQSAVLTMFPSLFWGAVMVGRGLASLVLRVIGERPLVWIGLAMGAGGILGLVQATTVPGAAAGAMACGLGFGPIFPLTVSMLTVASGGTNPRAASWVFAFGSFGGAALPWLVGWVSGSAGNLRWGLWVPASALVVMVGLQMAQGKWTRVG